MDELTRITMPTIIAEIARTVMIAPPNTVKRLRFAVTPDEYEEIRQYCFARDGEFYGMIRRCPLIIEEHPEHPLVMYEIAPAKVA